MPGDCGELRCNPEFGIRTGHREVIPPGGISWLAGWGAVSRAAPVPPLGLWLRFPSGVQSLREPQFSPLISYRKTTRIQPSGIVVYMQYATILVVVENDLQEDLTDFRPRGVTRYLPLYRMNVGQECFVPGELMWNGDPKRYDAARQSIYRWGYRHGMWFRIKKKDGGLWVRRVAGGKIAEVRETGTTENVNGRVLQDSQVPEVQEAYPVGAK